MKRCWNCTSAASLALFALTLLAWAETRNDVSQRRLYAQCGHARCTLMMTGGKAVLVKEHVACDLSFDVSEYPGSPCAMANAMGVIRDNAACHVSRYGFEYVRADLEMPWHGPRRYDVVLFPVWAILVLSGAAPALWLSRRSPQLLCPSFAASRGPWPLLPFRKT